VEAIFYPPVPDAQAEGNAWALFSGSLQMARNLNPELPGGSIALVAVNDNKRQEPPTCLSRMHASCGRQVAFNKSVLADFLMGMNLKEMSVVCVNVGNRMRGSQQGLWAAADSRRQTDVTDEYVVNRDGELS
jgi:hypothetical protein